MKTFIKMLEHDWKLFKLDDLSSKNYFEKYQKNQELGLLYIKNKRNHNNILNNIYANEIIYGNLKKKWTFIDLKDFKHYSVFNIIMLPGPIMIYFFNIDDPCFLIQNYCYMDFFYFGRIKIKTLIEISPSTSGNFRQLPIIEKNLDIIYNIGLNTKKPVIFNKTILFFGFINNPGHHLWNEVSGLFYFLSKINIKLIDAIAIGPYDFFNIKKYLSDTYNIKTINYTVKEYPIYFNTYPVFFNSVFIDDIITKPLKYFMNIDTDTDYNILKNSNKLQIVLDIRTNRRIIINIIELYIFIIQSLYKEIPSRYKLNIVFTGRFLTNLNNIDLNHDKEIHDQNLIVNKIINNFTNSNIVFDNLIGNYFENIIKHIHNANLMIVVFGTSAPNLINWICNTKTIGFVQPYHYCTYEETQNLCVTNSICSAVPINCFKSVDKNNNCIIDLKIFYEYFYNNFIKLL